MSEGGNNRRWFRFGLRTMFMVATTLLGCSGDQPLAQQLVSATLLREGISESGDPTWQVIRINDDATLAKLESFFPGYRQRPRGGPAGGWMRGYEVYFNFPSGESMHVVVEAKPHVRSWTINGGDLEIQGDFQAFAAGL